MSMWLPVIVTIIYLIFVPQSVFVKHDREVCVVWVHRAIADALVLKYNRTNDKGNCVNLKRQAPLRLFGGYVTPMIASNVPVDYLQKVISIGTMSNYIHANNGMQLFMPYL